MVMIANNCTCVDARLDKFNTAHITDMDVDI
jgi:hypothetical protein